MENRKTTQHELNYYKDKYFIGVKVNNRTQLLHYNKRGYEIRNEILDNVVIFNEKNPDNKKRFKTLKTSAFATCYKIPCLEHLFGIEQEKLKPWYIRLINKLVALCQR